MDRNRQKWTVLSSLAKLSQAQRIFLSLAQFCQFQPCLAKFNKVWPCLAKLIQVQSSLAKFSKVQPSLAKFSQVQQSIAKLSKVKQSKYIYIYFSSYFFLSVKLKSPFGNRKRRIGATTCIGWEIFCLPYVGFVFSGLFFSDLINIAWQLIYPSSTAVQLYNQCNSVVQQYSCKVQQQSTKVVQLMHFSIPLVQLYSTVVQQQSSIVGELQ